MAIHTKTAYTFALLLLFVLLTAGNAFAFSGGSGTNTDPFIITTPAELQDMENHTSAYFKLGNDIDMTGFDYAPIRHYNYDSGFTGGLDGDNFTIRNLEITTVYPYAGLFGRTNNAVLQNIRIENMTLDSGYFDCGLLTGNAYDTFIRNCYAQGTVIPDSNAENVGGLVGLLMNESTVIDSQTNVTITATKNSYVGGIIGGSNVRQGQGYNSTIENCSATANITAPQSNNVGGIIGSFCYGNLTNCTYDGNINLPNGTTGGLAGSVFRANITFCSVSGNISALCAGGLAGNFQDSFMSNCFSSVNVTGTGTLTGNAEDVTKFYSAIESAGSLVGDAREGSRILNCYATGEVNGVFRAGGLAGALRNNSVIENSFSTGNVTSENIAGGLVGLSIGSQIINSSISSSAPENWDGLTLPPDLAFGEQTVTGGTYSGGLAGYANNTTFSKTSSVLDMTSDKTAGGLLGAAVFNSSVSDSAASGNVTALTAGGLIGYLNNTSIVNCSASGSVTGTGTSDNTPQETVSDSGTPEKAAGGLIGDARNARISLSYASGNVTSPFRAGGLAGILRSGSEISHVFSTGVVSSDNIAGGLIGLALDSEISEISVTGNIPENWAGAPLTPAISEGVQNATGEMYAGGLAGYVNNSTVSNTSGQIDVISGSVAGGLIGAAVFNSSVSNSSASSDITALTAGGLIGFLNNSSVTDSYASGAVEGTGIPADSSITIDDSEIPQEAAGGLIGDARGSEVILSYAAGEVSGPFRAGGLIGTVRDGSSVNETFSTGSVYSENVAGGLIGLLVNSSVSDLSMTGNVPEDWAGLPVSDDIEITGEQTVKGISYAGGLIGYASGSVLQNISVSLDIESDGAAGGLTGAAVLSSTVNDSDASGDVSAYAAGGLIGYLSDSQVFDSSASGDVTGEGLPAAGSPEDIQTPDELQASAGGLIGDAQNSSIFKSYAVGNVEGPFRAGGLAGIIRQTSVLNNTFSTGTVSSGNISGGLTGILINSTVSHSFASGKVLDGWDEIADPLENGIAERTDVTGGFRAGGLVGYASNSTLQNTYTTVRVVSDTMAGGLIGNMSGTTIVNSLALNEYVNCTSACRLAGTSETLTRASSVINSYGWSKMKNADQTFAVSETNASELTSAHVWNTYPDSHEVWSSWDSENWTVNDYGIYLLPSPAWQDERFIADARHLIPSDDENENNTSDNSSSKGRGSGTGKAIVSGGTKTLESFDVEKSVPGSPVAQVLQVTVLLFIVAIACFVFVMKKEFES